MIIGQGRCAPYAVVFPLANRDPEVIRSPLASTRRWSPPGAPDVLNQINNVLAFPGVFRGLPDARA